MENYIFVKDVFLTFEVTREKRYFHKVLCHHISML